MRSSRPALRGAESDTAAQIGFGGRGSDERDRPAVEPALGSTAIDVRRQKMSKFADQLEQMRGALTSPHDGRGSQLAQQIEHMRVRMLEVARREHEMAAELEAVVRKMDEQLLQDVRSIAAAHEARRADILDELQMLATRLRDLPSPDRARPKIEASAPRLAPAHAERDQRLLGRHHEGTIDEALSRFVGQQRRSH
jgi:hypothetical protein